ncbi:MAG: copper chaperone PCu(A)C [Anderseniella sp.]|nr:copper chaperone PCu(A)C [Anderseniella sp.]
MHVKLLSLALFANLIAATGAHATLETPQAPANGYSKAVFDVSHEWDAQSEPAAPDIVILAASSGHGTGHASMNQSSYTVGDLVITNVRAGATVPKAPVAGGYMVIKNNGSASDFLVGGQAAFAGDVQIHEMKMQGDVMKMRELADGLEIPAGGEVMLQPGGYHVMFMKLTEPLKEGENRKATLTFKNAGSVEVEFGVKSRKDLKSHGMNHSKHGSSN